jgi:hypothetical protein
MKIGSNNEMEAGIAPQNLKKVLSITDRKQAINSLSIGAA